MAVGIFVMDNLDPVGLVGKIDFLMGGVLCRMVKVVNATNPGCES